MIQEELAVWTRDTAPPSPGVPFPATERAPLVLTPDANAWTFEGAGMDDPDALVDQVHPGIADELRDAAWISVEASRVRLPTVPDPVPS